MAARSASAQQIISAPQTISAQQERPALVRWAAAVVAVVAAYFANKAFPEGIDSAPFFIVAVMITTHLGGALPAVCAFVLSFGFLIYFHVPPIGTFTIRSEMLPALLQFIVPCALGGWFILKRSEIERLLQREYKPIAERLRLNELFVAAVAHDLRNPLLAVVTGSELIVRRSSDADAVRLAETLREGGKRMQRMTEALFDLTRARLGGGIPIERAPLDLRALAERVFREHQLSAPGQPMALVMAPDVRGEWDGTRLEQLLSNLLGNAVQHGVRGAPIRVELSSNEREVVLAVHNAGVISEPTLHDLFDPFHARSDGRRSDGLGLGLFIVQQIALAHSGRVEVCSTAEHGTTFRVQLPRL